MQSACRKTRIWTTFFLSVVIVFTLLHAQPEYVLNEVAAYNTNLSLSCFDWYNGTVYFSVNTSAMPYLYVLQFPSMQLSQKSVQSTDVNCVNSMSDGRILYSTPLAVYQTIPSLATPFDFFNIKEIKDYQGRYIVLTGYGSIRGTDQYGNMTKGTPFAYSSLSFNGIGTDGDRIYAPLSNKTIIVFNASFAEVNRIDLGDVAINGISVYGRGNGTIIAAPTDSGVYLLMLDKKIKSSNTVFSRCVIGNATLIVCSNASTLHFMEIVNVSEKVKEYLSLSATLGTYIANATNDEYVVWAQQQLNRSKSLEDTDIVTSLAILKNISITELQKRAKVEPVQNVTKNETSTANITASQPPATQTSLLMLGAIAIVLVVAFLAIIVIIAYYMLNRRHGSGPEGKGTDVGKGPKYKFG